MSQIARYSTSVITAICCFYHVPLGGFFMMFRRHALETRRAMLIALNQLPRSLRLQLLHLLKVRQAHQQFHRHCQRQFH